MPSDRVVARVVNKVRAPVVLNTPVRAYSSVADLYGDDTKGSYHKGIRTGLLVTVLIPPVLHSHKYPNFAVELQGLPFIDSALRTQIRQQFVNYRKAVTATGGNAELRRLKKALAKAEDATPKNEAYIKRLKTKIAALETSLGVGAGSLLAKYSVRFDISDFVTSLSWTSDEQNGYVSVSLGLDNSGGVFNYLPVGTAVTIWRKKSVTNFNTPGMGGRWTPYIKVWVSDKTRTADGRNQTMTVECHDRNAYFGANKVKPKSYKTDEKHPKGWSPREITIDLCKRHNIPYDAGKIPTYIIPKGTKGRLQGVKFPRLPKLEVNEESIAEYLAATWQQSRNKLKTADKRDLIIHMRRGVLEVEIVSPPGKWNSEYSFNTAHKLVLYDDNNTIEKATLSEKITDETVTVLNATGTITTKKKNATSGKTEVTKKKVKGTFKASPYALLAYGEKEVTRNFKKNKFTSQKDFSTFCQGWIDDHSRPTYDLQVSGKGILGLWPIRYVNVSSRYLGIRGHFRIKTITYTISSGSINVEMTLAVNKRVFVDGHKHYTKAKFSVDQYGMDKWY